MPSNSSPLNPNPSWIFTARPFNIFIIHRIHQLGTSRFIFAIFIHRFRPSDSQTQASRLSKNTEPAHSYIKKERSSRITHTTCTFMQTRSGRKRNKKPVDVT